jgi:hypothetical protein
MSRIGVAHNGAYRLPKTMIPHFQQKNMPDPGGKFPAYPKNVNNDLIIFLKCCFLEM